MARASAVSLLTELLMKSSVKLGLLPGEDNRGIVPKKGKRYATRVHILREAYRKRDERALVRLLHVRCPCEHAIRDSNPLDLCRDFDNSTKL